MEWPKLKNIILLMLLCVNAFLLVLEIQRQWESHTYAQGAREDAAAVLWETSRVHLDLDLLDPDAAGQLQIHIVAVARGVVGLAGQAVPGGLGGDGQRGADAQRLARHYVKLVG